MNELIEKLLRLSETEPVHGSKCNRSLIYVASFKQAIQAACKAQRNACARAYDRNTVTANSTTWQAIENAQIERQDYENN